MAVIVANKCSKRAFSYVKSAADEQMFAL